MSNSRIMCVFALATIILSVTSVYGGPARSLASVMAARTVKIPRAIRAPFRNNEMMTARGFGKRSQQMIKLKDGNNPKNGSFLLVSNELKSNIQWPIDKFDAQDGVNAVENSESTQKLLNAQFDESYPTEWIVQELLGNAAFLHSVLEHCVDVNHDGQISLRELFSSTAPPAPLTNDLM